MRQNTMQLANEDHEEEAFVSYEIVPGYVILLDADDIDNVEQLKWRVVRRKGIGFYFMATMRFNKKPLATTLSNWILKPLKGLCVRLKDLEKQSDYRKSNLEICHKSDLSVRQRAKKLNASSTHRGVYKDLKTNLWKSEIRPRGRRIFLGYFRSEKEAAAAYNRAALQYFGTVAHQNIILE